LPQATAPLAFQIFAETLDSGYRSKRREILLRRAPQDDGEKQSAPRDDEDPVMN
jgi:hypothetical protein